MTALVIAFSLAFGAIIGSFANAVLWRLHAGESIVHGRSHCVSCGHALSVADLVPILSYLALGGKCRYCRKGIGAAYVWVEVAMAATFGLLAHEAFGGAEVIGAGAFAGLLLHWAIAALLVMIFVYDHRHMLIPRQFTTIGSLLALAGGLALGMEPWRMALGALVGYGVFWLQFVLSKGRWIGGGDLHLGLMMGLALGWPHILVALFMAYVVGALVAVVLLARRRAGMETEIPFGTFLSAATVVTMLWGQPLLEWYLGARLPL